MAAPSSALGAASGLASSLFSTQTVPAQVWAPGQSSVVVQRVRQVLSTVRQTSGVGQLPWGSQVADWHTAPLSTRTQRSPLSQSRDVTHALWQAPNLHTSGSLQSLFRLHDPPKSNFLALLQAARAQASEIHDTTVFIVFSFIAKAQNAPGASPGQLRG
jgi:hypothetical protein